MSQPHDEIGLLLFPLVLLAAAVVSVPLARLLRLSPSLPIWRPGS